MERRSGNRPRVVFRIVIMILNFTPRAMGSPGRLLIGWDQVKGAEKRHLKKILQKSRQEGIVSWNRVVRAGPTRSRQIWDAF